MKLIPLSKGLFTEVDDEDFEYLNQWKWHAHESNKGCYYAARIGKRHTEEAGRLIFMHRQILGLTEGKIHGEHKDRNRLNNQRGNLRPATASQNQMNKKPLMKGSSMFIGVSWHKKYKKWFANIMLNRKQIYLGGYDSEVEAALAYNRASLKYFGEFGTQNDIPIAA